MILAYNSTVFQAKRPFLLISYLLNNQFRVESQDIGNKKFVIFNQKEICQYFIVVEFYLFLKELV